MDYVENNGVRVAYEAIGSGPPLVLQHGFSQDSAEWTQYGYVAPLAEKFRVVLLDMRGHGHSDKPHDGAAYALSNLVGDVVAVLDALGAGRAHYWGYSMGGWIGLGLLTQRPDRLGKVVLGGVQPYARKATPFKSDGSDAEAFMRELAQRFGLDFDALPAAFRAKLLAMDCRALAVAQGDRDSLAGLLPGITTPCLAYAGDKDRLYAEAQQGASAIPNSKFVTVPGGHVQAFQDAKAILPDVMKFLAA